MRRWSFTSESVAEGHPDKVADRISDSVLDAVLADDPYGRVACETLVTTNLAVIAGEMTTTADVPFEAVVRKAVADIGYTTNPDFSADSIKILVAVDEQSSDISDGVSESLETRTGSTDPGDQLGAGDQGMMFGYATDETDALMPMPIHLAHRLAERLAEARHGLEIPFVGPDAKTQVTVDYEGDRPVGVSHILISTQHSPDVDHTVLREVLWEQVVTKTVEEHLLEGTELLVNPSGRFVIGGPAGDAGLTGRKIIVDTYGGAARHGGGAFSGKDPTKVDRSAAYAARHAAKTVVAAGLARRCELQLAYAIGQARPVSVFVDLFGTGEVDERRLELLLNEFFDFRPAGIITELDLRRPIFALTSAYGHFGRSLPEFTWEASARAEELAAAAAGL